MKMKAWERVENWDFVLVNQLAIAMLWPTTCNGKTIWNTMPFKLWNNIIINGRLFVFFKQLWTHNWRFLHLGMDKSTTFYLVVFQIQGSMSYNWEFPSLQLLGFCGYVISLLGEWRNMCHANNYIMFRNMSCFVGSLNISFIFQFGTHVM